MTTKDIKGIIEQLEKEIKQQKEAELQFKDTVDGLKTYYEMQGEITAKQTLVYMLKMYL